MDAEERYSRQRDIVPAEGLAMHQATVIGVGAIGRQVALQLAAMGVARLHLVDFDLVEESNIASQGYLESDLGRPKAQATANSCRQINQKLEVQEVPQRFRRSMDTGSAVFCCVDQIDIRRLIWQSVRDKVSFFVDGRMSAEVLRVIAACDDATREHYPTTLFESDDAYQGSCTAKATIYCANVAAGLMAAQFAKYLRRLPVDPDIQLNLLANELAVLAP